MCVCVCVCVCGVRVRGLKTCKKNSFCLLPFSAAQFEVERGGLTAEKTFGVSSRAWWVDSCKDVWGFQSRVVG